MLAAVGQAGGAAAVVRTVRDCAVTPNFGITGGTGRNYPSFTVRASTGRPAGTAPRGVLTFYADSHGSGPALEVRVIEMCSTPPYDCEPARGRLTADLHALGIPRLDREGVLCRKRPEIPLADSHLRTSLRSSLSIKDSASARFSISSTARCATPRSSGAQRRPSQKCQPIPQTYSSMPK